MTGSAVSAVDVVFRNLLLEWEGSRGGWHRHWALQEAGGFIFMCFRGCFLGSVFVSVFGFLLGAFWDPFLVGSGLFFQCFFVSSFLLVF